MVSGAKRALLVTAMIGLTMAATGCREEEQGRPMVEQKGVYEGPADEPIGEKRVQELKSRAAGQQF